MARVEYVVQLDAQRVERCRLDASQPVREVVAELVRTFNLPTTDTSGHPMVYALYTEDNRRISMERSLIKAGVEAGATLKLADRQHPWWEPASPVPEGSSVLPTVPLPPPARRSFWSQGQVLPLVGGGIFVMLGIFIVIMSTLIPRSEPTSRGAVEGGDGRVPTIAATSSDRVSLAIQLTPSATLAPVRTATLLPTTPPETPTPDVVVVTVSGVLEAYQAINPSYFFRGRTSFGVYLFADDGLTTKLTATTGNIVVSNGDQVEILQDLGTIYQVRVITNKLDPDDPKVIGAIGYIAKWLIDNQNVPPTPTATRKPTPEPARLRVFKLNSDDSPNCFSMQIRGINAAGWLMRVDGIALEGRFDGGGNVRICGLQNYQEVTFTVYNNAGQAVPGGRGIPVRGGDIMIGEWR
jgi:hypothetical protein